MANGEAAKKISGPVYIELTISEDTAKFIKDMVQNPLMNNESNKSMLIRERLFTILKDLV